MKPQEQRRRERVASILQQAVADVLLREFSDPRMGKAIVSVTRVEVAPDVRSARVYVSIMGTDAEQRTAWRALEGAQGRIQSLVGQRVSLRWTPELFFRLDESIKKAYAVNQLIKQAMADTAATSGEAPAPENADDADGEDADESEEGEPTEGGEAADESDPAGRRRDDAGTPAAVGASERANPTVPATPDAGG
jgi:ribosome-binding factor A